MTPEKYGGAEAGSTEWVILAEEIARVSTAAAQMFENFGPAIPLRFLGSGARQEPAFICVGRVAQMNAGPRFPARPADQ